jgi:DNA-binding XRE family transcriptional regulator
MPNRSPQLGSPISSPELPSVANGWTSARHVPSAKIRRPKRPPGVDIRAGSVREARARAGLSLAKVAGNELTPMAIHHLESGRRRPSLATLVLVATRTKQPLSFFLPGAEPASGEVVAPSDRMSGAEHRSRN